MANAHKRKSNIRKEVVFTDEQKEILAEKLMKVTQEIEEIRKVSGVDRILINVCRSYEAFEAVMDDGMVRIVRSMKPSFTNEWEEL